MTASRFLDEVAAADKAVKPVIEPLQVYTARLGYKRDSDWLDVSLQGNMRRADNGERGGHRGIGLLFAPSPRLLYPYLSKKRFGKLTERDWEAYAEAYKKEMRATYRRHRWAFDCLLVWRRVVLLCFCTNHTECHRRVLAQILVKLGAVDRGEVT